MTTTIITASLNGFRAALDKVGAEMLDAARPAAYDGSDVLLEEVQKNFSKYPIMGGKDNTLYKALYRVFARRSQDGVPIYDVGVNMRKAPHWHLIEYGHWRYYAAKKLPNGDWVTLKRKGAKGKKPPQKASKAVKDAYYIPLKTPVWVPARPYLRPAKEALPKALAAARKTFLERIRAKR